MAFPTVVQELKKEQASDASSHTCWDNASPATAGNCLVCFFTSDCNTADSEYVTIAISTGIGWELIRQDGNGNFNIASAFLIKRVAEGNSNDNLTLSTSGITSAQQSSNICVEISGSNDFAISWIGSTGGSNPNPASVTGEDGTQDYLFYVYRGGDNTVVPSAAPTNYGNLNNQAATNAAGASSSVMRRTLNGASDDPGAMTCVSEQWNVYTVAFSPLVDIFATVAQTTKIETQSASGTESMTGTAAQTTPVAQQSASGTESITGTAAQTTIKAAQSASGAETISGTAAQTTPVAQQSASGQESISGDVSQQASPPTQSATGEETISGTASQATQPASQSAEGEVETGPPPTPSTPDFAAYPQGSGDGPLVEPKKIIVQYKNGKFTEYQEADAEFEDKKKEIREAKPLSDKFRALSEIPFESLTPEVIQEVEQSLDPFGLAPFFPVQDPIVPPVTIPLVVPPQPEIIDLAMFESQSKEDDWLVIMALIESGDI